MAHPLRMRFSDGDLLFLETGSVRALRDPPGDPHLLSVIDPEGVVNTERYESADELEQRWKQMRDELSRDGWIGPFGRDARV